MKSKIVILLVYLGLIGVIVTTLGFCFDKPGALAETQLQRFSSYEELADFLKTSTSGFGTLSMPS